MTWYKIVVDSMIVAVGKTIDLRKVQEKHQILVTCGEDDAQYIQCGETLYHDTWFAPVTSSLYAYTDALIYVIGVEEYLRLKAEIDAGNEPQQPDDPETEPELAEDNDDPDTEQAKTRLQVLEEQVAQMREENNVLTECLLEMSEIVYA